MHLFRNKQSTDRIGDLSIDNSRFCLQVCTKPKRTFWGDLWSTLPRSYRTSYVPYGHVLVQRSKMTAAGATHKLERSRPSPSLDATRESAALELGGSGSSRHHDSAAIRVIRRDRRRTRNRTYFSQPPARAVARNGERSPSYPANRVSGFSFFVYNKLRNGETSHALFANSRRDEK